MGRTVVFFGAGASAALGLPVTRDIFPQLLDRLMSLRTGGKPLFGGDPDDQKCLRRCLETIFPGLSDFVAGSGKRDTLRNTLPLITDVLSAVDYLLLSSNAPGFDFNLTELARARTLLERALFEFLVRNESPDALALKGVPKSVHKEWNKTDQCQLLPPRPRNYEKELQRTVSWLMDLAQDDGDRVTLISTNYDIELEQNLFVRLGYRGVFDSVDFGMSVREPDLGVVHRRPEYARFGIYKLHGSLNWLRCDLCDNVYLNPVGAVAYLSFLLGDDAKRYKRQNPWLKRLEKNGANRCHCGYRPLRHVIVAPSYVRNVHDPVLLEIWRNALEALRQADKWIIVGYSLPPEDVAIRSLFLRAYQGRDAEGQPRVVVVQKKEKKKEQEPDPTRARYQLLFKEHNYEVTGLSGYIGSRDQSAV